MFVTTEGTIKGGTTDTSDVVYILSTTPDVSVDEDENTYYTYTAIVNGTKTTINANADTVFVNNDGSPVESVGLYMDVTYDSDGYVDSATLLDGTTADDNHIYETYTTTDKISYKSGVMMIGDDAYSLADDCVIRTVDGTTVKTVTASKLASTYKDGLKASTNVSVILDDDEVVTTLILDISAES